jgi:hypothetical protein
LSDILLSEQSNPTTPASGTLVLFPDSTASAPAAKNDGGRSALLWVRANASIAAQGAGFSSDTYVTDSDILIPSFGMQARMVFRWTISASKTGAGTATPIYNVRIGANRTTGDTARLTLTGPAQTAVADIGTLTILVTVRSVSASGVLQGTAWWQHRGTAASTTVSGVGFANDTTGHVEGTSAGFDNSALGGSYIGLSIDGGTSAAWTVTQVVPEFLG